jgi:hypothetical protein
MKRIWIPLLLATFVLAVPASAADLTWIGISGPPDWQPDPGYSLEIEATAWTVDANNGGGLVTVDLQVPTIIRVRRLSDCLPVVRFTAQPGRQYSIRFAADGTARVEDRTGRGMDTPGPPGDPGPLVCPRLPDTATTTPAPSTVRPEQIVAVLTIWAGVLGLVLRRARCPGTHVPLG